LTHKLEKLDLHTSEIMTNLAFIDAHTYSEWPQQLSPLPVPQLVKSIRKYRLPVDLQYDVMVLSSSKTTV
jgi:hypothetical protein